MSEFIIALHSLVFLMHTGVSKSSEELSTNLCTNPVRIRKVMAKCKRYGLVTTKAGVNGGYMVVDGGENINLKQIYDAVSVPIIESKWHSGDMNSDCSICSGMAQYVDEMFSRMNEECVKLLETIKLCDVEDRLGQIKELKL
ncbi:Rrf2 family transcriptional regulator [Peptostreptococcus sp. MV1]|uniref:RrF2 family transcriptional regulator n=1 Tax=Peptostreptococcus sp. MV1 TaxID=1219626 RepID=UPI00050E45AA|nr:Rrf2 family transcriptional regulator [Peptostreptococcus sp. MV1]KGF12675.1 Rrf2 family transcriptional regulator [Peptostreptococcus sp. MV1]